ncbi:uncharacterized protein LOC135370210 [Ornithodoros turicata]|uniref:uncharacterized protein LOC135370210 n=1 Tax=Ornithodoros turicata TaxID=34597 RepID=UPI003139EDCE
MSWSLRDSLIFYVVLTWMALSMEAAAAITCGAVTDISRRPYVWITYGKHAVVRSVSLCVGIFAYIGYIRSLFLQWLLCTVLIAALTIGNFLYGTYYYVYVTYIRKMGVIESYKRASFEHSLHPRWYLAYVISSTIAEGILVWYMFKYYITSTKKKVKESTVSSGANQDSTTQKDSGANPATSEEE